MFNSQGIPHTNQRVIGIVQAERGLSFEDLKRNSTPNSELFFQGSMGRVWSQDTKLSADIIYSSLQIEENRKVMRQIIKEFEFMLNAATPELIADRFKQAEQVLFRKEDKDISETKVEIGEKTGKLIEAQKHIF
jgi:prephenate dehydrogenase